ncbi:MAG: hypothetical protein ACREJP_06895 [Candidatus Methylomirabilales bacterium]
MALIVLALLVVAVALLVVSAVATVRSLLDLASVGRRFLAEVVPMAGGLAEAGSELAARSARIARRA